MKRLFSAVLFTLVVSGCVTHQQSSFVGAYYSPQPCSLGSDFDLSLFVDGGYRLIRTLPEGVGPEMPTGERAGFEEIGSWSFDGTAVVLKSTVGKKMRLKPEYQDDILVLADPKILGLRLVKQRPNQSSQRNAMNQPFSVFESRSSRG